MRMRLNQTTRSLATAGCILASASAAVASAVTAEEFAATHIGKCIAYTGPSEGRQCYAADGTANYDDKTYGTDTGKWKTDGDKMCISWDSDPNWACAAWTRDGDVFSDGSYSWTIE